MVTTSTSCIPRSVFYTPALADTPRYDNPIEGWKACICCPRPRDTRKPARTMAESVYSCAPHATVRHAATSTDTAQGLDSRLQRLRYVPYQSWDEAASLLLFGRFFCCTNSLCFVRLGRHVLRRCEHSWPGSVWSCDFDYTDMHAHSTAMPHARSRSRGAHICIADAMIFLLTVFCAIASATSHTDGLESQAVLLLRPNVPLYSTDALPINCSAFSPEMDPSTHAPSASTSSTASSATSQNHRRPSQSGPTGDLPQPNGYSERTPTRTCECLTQTLCCHGCGSAVGYMIVTPCQRCTSSITVNNRATNGHRFVFYSSEITACERHYVEGERGVSRFHPPAPPSVQSIQAGLANLSLSALNMPHTRPVVAQQPSPSPPSPSTPSSMPPLSPGPFISGRRTSIDYLPTPPPEIDSPFIPNPPTVFATNAAVSTPSRRASLSAAANGTSIPSQSRFGPLEMAQIVPPVPPNSHSTSPHAGGDPTHSSNASSQASSPTLVSPSRARAASTSAALSAAAQAQVANTVQGYVVSGSSVFLQRPFQSVQPVQPPPPPPPEPIKHGEVLFWHHLLRSGEIPAVSEDPRARADGESGDAKGADTGRRNTLPSGIVAGR
ncbi:hypothetical protein C8Q74DRAFT_726940 [Fomes fomentarius]|nr:hypothetical protein C8Q74DRAFT_726940 [Fomes fomentarius]